MTFSQISYILEVARYGSINKAAQAIFVSQSTISSAIKELETEFGITIFYRSSKGVELTALGRDFVTYARTLAEYKNQLENLFLSDLTPRHVSRNVIGKFNSILSEKYTIT
jgi:DNA-binding transcriptional LysR family regulator